MYMHPARPVPPTITAVLRPQPSAYRVAGMEIASMRIADKPDARNEDVPLGKPAWTKSIGAYYRGRQVSDAKDFNLLPACNRNLHRALHQCHTIGSFQG